MHITLRRWADLLVVAPLSAHTLAKFAHGYCDDVLSSVMRAWNFSDRQKAIILVPAMNTAMWEHPLTRQQLEAVQRFAPTATSVVTVVEPVVKTLACGVVGQGALAPVDEIIAHVQRVVVAQSMIVATNPQKVGQVSEA